MFLLLFILWIILNGRITTEIILFDILIVLTAAIFSRKVLGYSIRREIRFYRNIPFLILFILNLVVEIIKASILVISDAFSPSGKPSPCVVEFYSGLNTSLANVLLANSITLTPGTFTLFQQGDHFVVHCLKREYVQGIEDSSFIRLLRKLK